MDRFPDMDYAYEDDYGNPIRPRRPRMSSQFQGNYLDPEGMGGTRLHRSRSTGQRPAPNVYIQNDIFQDNYQRQESPAPPRGRQYTPQPNYYYNMPPQPIAVPIGQQAPQPPVIVMPPAPPPQHHSRSRSHSRTPSGRHEHLAELARLEELKRRAEEEHNKHELKNAISDYERQRAEAEAETQRKVNDYERKKAEAEAETLRKVKAYEAAEAEKRKQADEARKEAVRKAKLEEEEKKKREKEHDEEIIRKWKQQEEDKKKKQKEEEEEFERRRAERLAKEKAKKEKEEEEYKERMRRDLSKAGMSENQIERVLSDEKKKAEGKTIALFQRPTFPKVHRKHVAVETLKYYDLPWEYDRLDSDYIIILREMTERETDILFEHTRRIHSRAVLMIEDRGRGSKPEYAWVRKRSKSRAKSTTREKFAGLFIS